MAKAEAWKGSTGHWYRGDKGSFGPRISVPEYHPLARIEEWLTISNPPPPLLVLVVDCGGHRFSNESFREILKRSNLRRLEDLPFETTAPARVDRSRSGR